MKRRVRPTNRWAFAAVVIVVAMVSGALPPAHAGTSPAVLSAASAPVEQVYGIAATYGSLSGTYWQNGTMEYQSGASPWTFPIGFTNYSALTYIAFGLAVSINSTLEPMVNVKQGTSTLLNNTGTGTFVVYPPNGSQSLHVTVPTAFLPGGGIPPDNMTYPLVDRAQLVLDYQSTQSSSWVVSGKQDTESFTLSAPTGYWLNQTTIYLPFPSSTDVNYTSVTVTSGGNDYSYVQLTAGGVYISDPVLSRGSSIKFVVSFSPTPTEVGTAPLLIVTNYTKNTASGPTYAASATWVNHLYPLWGGMYLIEMDIPYAISSVNVTENGRALSVGSFLVSGNIITILPLVIVTPMNGTASFHLEFDLPSAPPLASITVTSSGSLLGVSVSLGDALIAVIVVSLLGLLVIWVPRYVETYEGRARKNPVTPERYAATYGLIGLIISAAAAYGVLR